MISSIELLPRFSGESGESFAFDFFCVIVTVKVPNEVNRNLIRLCWQLFE